nr:hypothetical protein [Providencia sp.]
MCDVFISEARIYFASFLFARIKTVLYFLIKMGDSELRVFIILWDFICE